MWDMEMWDKEMWDKEMWDKEIWDKERSLTGRTGGRTILPIASQDLGTLLH